MNKLTWRARSTLTTRPNLNGTTATNDCVQRKREDNLWFVVYLAFDLPFANVLIATLAGVFDEHEFAIGRDFFNSDWA